jgi:hypothetical protein
MAIRSRIRSMRISDVNASIFARGVTIGRFQTNSVAGRPMVTVAYR